MCRNLLTTVNLFTNTICIAKICTLSTRWVVCCILRFALTSSSFKPAPLMFIWKYVSTSRQRLLSFYRSHHRSGKRTRVSSSLHTAQKASHLILPLFPQLSLLTCPVLPVAHPQQDQWLVIPAPSLVHWLICLSSQFHALCKSQSSCGHCPTIRFLHISGSMIRHPCVLTLQLMRLPSLRTLLLRSMFTILLLMPQEYHQVHTTCKCLFWTSFVFIIHSL